MDKLINLECDQQIKIEETIYTIIGMLKFVEGSSYWKEYILRNSNNEIYYLDVEPIGKCALHKMIKLDVEPNINIMYEGDVYNLFQKGNAKIQTYTGYTDVGLNDTVEYYEYINENKLFTIEKWKDEIEVSVGKYIKSNKIKVMKNKKDMI